jgi:hypothetical protein
MITPTPLPNCDLPIDPTCLGGGMPFSPNPDPSGFDAEVINNSTVSVCFLYIADSNDLTSWGPDQLGPTSTISSGGSVFTITDIPSGTYDIMTEDCERNVISWNYEINITQNMTLTVSGSPRQLVLENTSSFDICTLNIARSDGGTNWGRSQVNDEHPIPAGETRSFAVEAGTWDLRAVTCSGAEITQMGEQISGDHTWTVMD